MHNSGLPAATLPRWPPTHNQMRLSHRDTATLCTGQVIPTPRKLTQALASSVSGARVRALASNQVSN